jgi:hypothetical protein
MVRKSNNKIRNSHWFSLPVFPLSHDEVDEAARPWSPFPAPKQIFIYIVASNEAMVILSIAPQQNI